MRTQTKRSNGYGARPAIREIPGVPRLPGAPRLPGDPCPPGVPRLPRGPPAGNLLLDERTWNAITVAAAAPPTGVIDAAWVRVGAVSYPCTQFPVTLASNTGVKAIVGGRNTSGQTLPMQLQVHLIDPTGTLRGYNSITGDFPPLMRMLVETPIDVPLNIVGTWVVKGVLKEYV